jgi:PqqD family protein of HPr-rel-A system
VENFEGEYIAYNPSSGETHVLNEYARRILELIADTPLTLENLMMLLKDRHQLDPDPEILSIHLGLLEDWGIAQRLF